MKHLTLIVALAASPATADVKLVLMPEGSDHLAELVVNNVVTSSLNETGHSFDLAGDKVLVSVTHTPNNAPQCCDDIANILSLPEGIVADAIDITVPENGRVAIKLYEWSGM